MQGGSCPRLSTLPSKFGMFPQVRSSQTDLLRFKLELFRSLRKLSHLKIMTISCIFFRILNHKQVDIFDYASKKTAFLFTTLKMDFFFQLYLLGHLIDSVRFPSAVTSLTISPQSDFLATSHIGDLGIYLWTNVSLYKHISLKPLPEDFVPRQVSNFKNHGQNSLNIWKDN